MEMPKDRRSIAALGWAVVQLIGFMTMIAYFAAAGKSEGGETFSLTWKGLLFGGLSFINYFLLFKQGTEFPFGLFLGNSFLLNQFALTDGAHSISPTLSGFAITYFLFSLASTSAIYLWRDEFIDVVVGASFETEPAYPSDQPYHGSV